MDKLRPPIFQKTWLAAFGSLTDRSLVAALAVIASSMVVAISAMASGEIDDRFAADPKLQRFLASVHGDAIGVDLARLQYRKRWETMLDEYLYLIAPRGAWDKTHPAWIPARNALADAIRHESIAWLAENHAVIHLILDEQSMRVLTEDERQQLTDFFETPWGATFRRRREAGMREKAFGLPFGVEGETQSELNRASAASSEALHALDNQAGGAAIDQFVKSPLIKKYFKLQNEVWADYLENVMASDLQSLVLSKQAYLTELVRTAVPGIPPASDKTYLGTVTMASDRTFTVTIEHYAYLSLRAKYTLKYGVNDLPWGDIAAAVPGIHVGETRPLFRAPSGKLGDLP